MKTWKVVALTVLVVFGVFFMVILAVGIYYTPQTDIQQQTKPETPYPPPPTPTKTYDDQEFLTWVSSMMNTLSDYGDKEVGYLQDDSWYSLESLCQQEESYIDDTLKPQCNEFTLSSTYIPLRTEITGFLYDRSWAVFYMKLAAGDMQGDYYTLATENFNKATEYINNAKTHVETYTALIQGMT
jgi:hypothetical protein